MKKNQSTISIVMSTTGSESETESVQAYDWSEYTIADCETSEGSTDAEDEDEDDEDDEEDEEDTRTEMLRPYSLKRKKIQVAAVYSKILEAETDFQPE